jgi:hypothetical protein
MPKPAAAGSDRGTKRHTRPQTIQHSVERISQESQNPQAVDPAVNQGRPRLECPGSERQECPAHFSVPIQLALYSSTEAANRPAIPPPKFSSSNQHPHANIRHVIKSDSSNKLKTNPWSIQGRLHRVDPVEAQGGSQHRAVNGEAHEHTLSSWWLQSLVWAG